ncbi:MAG: hypothetical protein O2907_07265 [Proteobacteria bacterium]|nr:hypothetical protein [Pseudomonadota bacterium]
MKHQRKFGVLSDGRAVTEYTLRNRHGLSTGVIYATTDTQTVVNLTQHSYFNLSGDPGNTILDHILAVNSDQVLELDDTSILTGRILDVTNSRFDFRIPKRIAANGNGGYDNFWVLSKDLATEWAADLRHPESGRVLQIVTTAPGVQIYTGNAIPDGLVG